MTSDDTWMSSVGCWRLRRLAAIYFALLSALGGFAPLHAQPSDGADLTPVHSRQRRFAIPFHVDESPQAALPHQVQLHVSEDGGASWRLHVALPPQEKRFIFEAPDDGEYLFLVRSVDAVGRTQTADAPRPELKVIVDSAAPAAEMSARRAADGSVFVEWSASDAHLDAAARRLRFRPMGDVSWREQPLTVNSDSETSAAGGATILTEPAWEGVELQLEIVDAAGNRTVTSDYVELTREAPRQAGWDGGAAPSGVLRLPPVAASPGALVAGRPPQTPASNRRFDPPPADARWVRSREDRIESSQSQMWAPRVAANPPGRRASRDTATVQRRAGPEVETIPTPDPAFEQQQLAAREAGYHGVAEEIGADARDIAASTENESILDDDVARFPPLESAPDSFAADDIFGQEELEPSDQGFIPAWDAPLNAEDVYDEEETSSESDSSNAEPWPPRWSDERGAESEEPLAEDAIFVKTPTVAVEYQTESPQGELTEVEIWGTSDAGASWRLYGVDEDLESPAQVDLRAPGRHGLRVVAADQRGWNSGRPDSGDAPDVWIDYDPTPPHARLLRAEIEASGEIAVFWEAADRRLAENPVTIRFADDRRGPWNVVASKIPNSGEYRWTLPEEAPPRIYFKIEVLDEAGNIGEDAAGRPVMLEHLRPRASIRGVRAADARSRRWVQLF